MTPALTSLDNLRSLLPADCLSERDGHLVASPRTTEEVAAIARYVDDRRLAIEIVGAGTKRAWGNPVTADILLDTTKLTGVREHSWQDLTATVAAGTPWAAMQRALAVHRQQVALDPIWPETATVGGILATNDSGALRLRYGSLRDLVIGMTIVLADGTVAKSGGKVVKNVAGYDLHKLMIGAFGTLGIITEVTFRLHPIPAHTSTWTVSSAAVEPLGQLMMKALDSQLSTQAMQLRGGVDRFNLDVQLATLPEAVLVQVGALDGLARNFGVTAQLLSPAHPDPFTARERIFSEPGVVIKVTTLPSSIGIVATEVVRVGGTSVAQASGIIFARVSERTAHETLPRLRSVVDDDDRDGSLTIMRIPKQFGALRGTEKALPLMHEIKRRFDPNRILNPGRFLGGI
jgi:glycolate oxidase FAD binding subunit